jgi:hypothetical protein
MRHGKLWVFWVLPLLLPALLLQAGSPNKLQPDELTRLKLHYADVSLISPASPTLLALANSAGTSDSQEVRPSLRPKKRWVRWAWIGGIAATVLVVGADAWAVSTGRGSQTFGGL